MYITGTQFVSTRCHWYLLIKYFLHDRVHALKYACHLYYVPLDLTLVANKFTLIFQDCTDIGAHNSDEFWIHELYPTFFFSCDQAALQMVFSVCLSVCPSVRLSVCPSHLFDYVPIIVSSYNFQELLPMTNVSSMQKVKVRGQRSRSQRSQPNLTVSGL